LKCEGSYEVSRLRVQGDPAGSDIGTFDPSIVSSSDGTAAMSYTSVDLQRNKASRAMASATGCWLAAIKRGRGTLRA
jgi:hypothetical protein